MKISCVICSDLFIPSSEVFITKCGHLFHHHCLLSWLERKETCPQCRHHVTERSIHKVYFSVQESQLKEDIGTLINKVENLEMKNLMSDKSLAIYKDKLRKQEEICRELRQEVYTLEENERTHKSVVISLKEKMRILKEGYEEANKLRNEVITLKNQIQDMKNIEVAVTGTQGEVETLIRNEESVESIALLASVLKKSLIEAQLKKRNAEQKLRKLKNDHVCLKQTFTEISAKYEALQKNQDYLKRNMELEKGYLKRKIEELKEKHERFSTSDETLQRIMLESPINVNRTLPETLLLDDSNPVANTKPVPSQTQVNNEPPKLGVSPKLAANDYQALFTAKVSSSTRVSGKPYSIFKCDLRSKDHKPSATAVSYDGLGGSAAEDIFPIPRPKAVKMKRPTSSVTIISAKKKKVAPIENRAPWKL